MRSAHKSLATFTKQLATQTSAVGSGGLTALLGMLGCGLLSRVAHSTVAKRGFNGYKERARKAMKESIRFRLRLSELIDKEAMAHERLTKVLKRPQVHARSLQPALKRTVTSLLAVCRCVHRAAVLSLELAYVGDKDCISDVCAAIYILDAAFESALVNLKVNFVPIRDKNYVVRNTHFCTGLHRDIKRIKTDVISKAKQKMFI